MPPIESPINDLNTVTPLVTLSVFDWIALAILIVGGLNWGLVGLANVDMVALIFGSDTTAARIVYVIVGLVAIYCIFLTVRLSGYRR